jgi:23S rRNA (cytidine1920-2'-O)/16S rRNA (cytidine1409-2'-O)-methyltransferase
VEVNDAKMRRQDTKSSARPPKVRLDRLIVERGLAASVEIAQAMVMAGDVDLPGWRGRSTPTAGSRVPSDTPVLVNEKPRYVSRGGLKLEAAITQFGVDFAGKAVLDIGASTGGFTDVLLRSGARQVYAVDVGTGQLHPSLKSNRAVVELEKIDARALDRALVPEPPEFITIDVSFISLKLILPVIASLAAPAAEFVALIKPQFEAGRKLVRKGVVRDATVHRNICDDLATFTAEHGWHVLDVIDSPIEGGDGNREFLLGARRGAGRPRKT